MTSHAKPAETRAPEGATARARARARTCVGCQGHEDARELLALVRLVLGPGGAIAVDPGSGGFGRGAYVHARPSCLASAVAKGLPRAARSAVFLADAVPGEQERLPFDADARPAERPTKLTAESLAGAIARAMDRRVEGLLASAARARKLALGADAVTGAAQRDEAKLVVVACDAAAAAELGEVRRAVAEGRAVAWGTKARLARAVDPRAAERTDGVGVVAVTSQEIATAMRAAVHARDAVGAGHVQAKADRDARRSVRSSPGAARDGRDGAAESPSGNVEAVVVGRSSVERGS